MRYTTKLLSVRILLSMGAFVAALLLSIPPTPAGAVAPPSSETSPPPYLQAAQEQIADRHTLLHVATDQKLVIPR